MPFRLCRRKSLGLNFKVGKEVQAKSEELKWIFYFIFIVFCQSSHLVEQFYTGLLGDCNWKMPNSVLRKEKFWIFLYKLLWTKKKVNYIKILQKFRKQPIKKKAKFLGRASKRPKPGNPCFYTLCVCQNQPEYYWLLPSRKSSGSSKVPNNQPPQKIPAQIRAVGTKSGHLRYFFIFFLFFFKLFFF